MIEVSSLIQHWNDVLTVLTFLITVLIGYYQVQHYRAQSPTISIHNVENAEYAPRNKNGFSHGYADEDYQSTFYSLHTEAENSGREPATISEATLRLPDTGEELTLMNQQTRAGRRSVNVKIQGNDRKPIYYTTHGKVRDRYDGNVEGELRLDTTAGFVSENVIFLPAD